LQNPSSIRFQSGKPRFSAIPRTLFKEPAGQLINEFIPGKSGSPACRDSLDTITGTGDLAVDGGGGVGIVAQVDRQQASLLKVCSMVKSP
jgi:hypothetical protein